MMQRVRGTQDFLDLTLFNFIIDRARRHLQRYAFREIATPILEPTELFKRSLGIFTDVVSKEMYTICAGEGDEQICLRPEATAATMRAFFNNNVEERPWRVFSWGSMFRHERPQKGRYRQFHQLNIEYIGAPSLFTDVECIALIDSFLSQGLMLDNYALHLNFLGSLEDRERYRGELRAFLDAQPVLPKAIVDRKETNLLRIFDLKDSDCQALLANAPTLIDSLSPESHAEWEQLQTLLAHVGVSFVINPRLVRGLDYYNKTVFEFVSMALGAQNALGGGGRYDYLSQTLGESDMVPSIGAALGIERLLLLLESRRDTLPLPREKALVALLPVAEAQQPLVLVCAQFLRHHGVCCESFFDGGSVKSMMRRANKHGARFAVIIGEEEQRENLVVVKDMVTGSEKKVRQEQLLDELNVT